MRYSWHSSRAHCHVLNWLRLQLLNPLSLLFLLLFLSSCASGQQFLNLSIPVNSLQIVYTPFVCNFTDAQANPQSCAGAWRLSADNTTISTTGPSLNSNNIIPQLFFQFRASDLILTTLPSSNATLNITASSNGTTVSTLFNSTLRLATIINLPESLVSQLTLTFVPSNVSTTFDLQGIIITTLGNGTLTSILPSQTLPPSISLPPFTPPTSTSSSSITTSTPTNSPATVGSAKGKRIAEAVGLTVGIGLGLTILLSGVFVCWRRQRQRDSMLINDTQSEWVRNGRSR